MEALKKLYSEAGEGAVLSLDPNDSDLPAYRALAKDGLVLVGESGGKVNVKLSDAGLAAIAEASS